MVLTDAQKRAIKKYRQGNGKDAVNRKALEAYHQKASLAKHIKQLMKIEIN